MPLVKIMEIDSFFEWYDAKTKEKVNSILSATMPILSATMPIFFLLGSVAVVNEGGRTQLIQKARMK